MAKEINQLVQLSDLMKGITILLGKIEARFLRKTGDKIGTVSVTKNKTYGDIAPETLAEEQLFFEKINLNEVSYPVGICILMANEYDPDTAIGEKWKSIGTITTSGGNVLNVWQRIKISEI